MGLNIDEASYGYDAYSLLQTGNDQWGIHLPTNLKSFGDYKPGALSYLIATLIPLFDLNTFSVRLPSAIAGCLILPFLYLTLQELFPHPKRNFFLICVFAFSPWALGISRLFYESNVGLLFYVIAFWSSLHFFRSPSLKFAMWIGASFALSGYWYEGLRFTNFFTLGLLIFLLFKKQPKQLKRLLVMALVYVIVSLPLISSTLAGGLTRIGQENNSQSYGDALYINENRSMCYLSSGKNILFGKLCALWWNKPEERFTHIARAFINQTGPVYLFLRSTQSDIVSPNYGSYLWILFPVYLVGLFVVIGQLSKTHPKRFLFIFLILGYLLANLPGALVGEPMIHRNVSGLYLGFIFISAGMDLLYRLAAKHKHGRLLMGAYHLAIIFFITQFVVYYFFVYTKLNPEIWHSDSQEIFSYLSQHKNEYDTYYFQGFENAPLYYAFYSKYDPTVYQQYMQKALPNPGGWIHLKKLGNLESTPLTLFDFLCQRYFLGKPIKSLYIGAPDPRYSPYAITSTYLFSKDYRLHDIYNVDQVYETIKLHQNLQSECKDRPQ
ncbi:MAG: glycosyltransferase family 39 protein [bacterium]